MINWFKTKFWYVPIPHDCEATYDRDGLLITNSNSNDLNVRIKFLYKKGRETDLTDLEAYSQGMKSLEYLESYKIHKWKGFLREDNKLFLRNGYHFLIVEIKTDIHNNLLQIIGEMKLRKNAKSQP